MVGAVEHGAKALHGAGGRPDSADNGDGEQALRRAGIFLSDAQKEQIKSLMELNRVGEAQKVILDEVASRTGGAAAEASKTLSGSWQNLKNDIGNIAESIGSVLGPPLKWLIQGLNGIVLVAQKMADGIGWIVDKSKSEDFPGIDIAQQKCVVLKSRGHFRAGFDEFIQRRFHRR